MSPEQSRPHMPATEIIHQLASTAFDSRYEAAMQLPTALSQKELSSLAIRVSSVNCETTSFKEGTEAETRALHTIGLIALRRRGDLVTASNTVNLLRENRHYIDWFILRRTLKKTQKQIVQGMMPEITFE